jgi:hypothetical protein
MKSGARTVNGQNRCKLKSVALSRSDLVATARKNGFDDISERLVTDWVAAGLLSRPERVTRGKGEGRGARYEWPETQRDLFLTLLAKRCEVKSQAGLCVVPVGVWMYWGDNWIPLAQVRRALKTWWDRVGRATEDRKAQAARQVVDTFAPAGTPRETKTRVRELIIGGLEQEVFPREELTVEIEQLLLARSSDGRFGMHRSRAEELVDGMWAMWVAMDTYDELTDGMFIEARARLRAITLSYATEWPGLRGDPAWGRFLERPTWEFLINRSCGQLLTGLGLQVLAARDERHLPPAPVANWRRPPPTLANLPLRGER